MRRAQPAASQTMIWSFVRRAHASAHRNPGKLFLIGLAGVAVYNWRQWQRDKALAARLRSARTPIPKLSRTPKVSALVAAWNEHEHIDAHIRSFLALTYPDIELILCAGGDDDTLERARRYASERVIVLEQHPGEGKQRALARCLEHASGEVIYLTDADCRFNDEALLRLLAPIVEEGEQVATGCSRPLDIQYHKLLPGYLWISDVVSAAQRSDYNDGLLGRNTALKRQTLDSIGGFDFAAPTGTDYQLAKRLLRAGVPIRYVGTSVVPSEYPETLHEYRRKQARWLRNLLVYGPQYGATRDVQATVKTMAVGAGMLLAPASSIVLGRSVLLIWWLLIAHAASSKLRYALFTARLCRWPVPKRLLFGLIPLTLIDFAIWVQPVIDLLHPRRRVQW